MYTSPGAFFLNADDPGLKVETEKEKDNASYGKTISSLLKKNDGIMLKVITMEV